MLAVILLELLGVKQKQSQVLNDSQVLSAGCGLELI